MKYHHAVSWALAAALATAGVARGDDSDTLSLNLLPTSTPVGGRCADGTMAGYYIHEGTDPSLYVIFLEGGGACYDEETCIQRTHMHLGSSKYWENTVDGTLCVCQLLWP